MGFKWMNFSLIAVCLAQVQGAPQVQGTPRDLAADLAAAEVTTQTLIVDTNEMIFQETKFSNMVSTDVYVIMKDMVTKLADFGIPESQLDNLRTNMSISQEKIETIVSENISYLTELLDLLNSILEHLVSDQYQLLNDSWALTEQRNKIHYYFVTAMIDINAEIKDIELLLSFLTRELTPEQAAEIDADMATARGLMSTLLDVIVGAKSTVEIGISVLIRQLEAISVQLPRPQ